MSNPVEAEECGEIVRFHQMELLYYVGAVNSILCTKDTAREDTKLEELCDRVVLCCFCG